MLRIQMSHFGGGIATMLGRIRKFQDLRDGGAPVHGKLPKHDLDYYLRERLVFDTAGVCGAITSSLSSLAELNPARIVLGRRNFSKAACCWARHIRRDLDDGAGEREQRRVESRDRRIRDFSRRSGRR